MMTEEIGEVVIRRFSPDPLEPDRLVVDHADPIARVSADLLQEISILTVRGEDRWTSLDGDVLTIKADNRTVIYVVDWQSYDHATDSYVMRWPD